MLYQFSSCSLDLVRGCLRVDGQESGLRPKSFDALRYLVENPGRLISKDELIKALWPDTAVGDESLANCISEVRRAVGDRDQTIIKTVPRRGYIFTPIVTVQEPADGQAAVKAALERALPEKPSLAVLPLANMSGDPAQEYFSDGMTEDIITELSRFGDLFVIARNSSFQFKGKAVDIRQIGRELGVRYVLEGSIRQAAGNVRVNAQLIDVLSGVHLWAERYDRKLEDAFAVQDEVARAIASVLMSHVTRAEQERTRLKPPSSWQAYDYCVQGFDLFVAFMTTYKGDELHAARQTLQRAIELDPGYARAHAVLSNVEAVFWSHQVDSSYLDPAVLDRAARLSQKAVQLDPHLPQAYGSRILPLTWTHQHEAALAAIDRALLLNPNFIDTRFVPGFLYAGTFDRCIDCARTTMRVDPFYRPITTVWLGWAHYMLGDYRDALPPLREAVLRAPNTRHPHTPLAATYAQLGRMEEARQAATHVLRLDPGWTLQQSLSVNVYRNREDVEHLIDGLRKAGLPV